MILNSNDEVLQDFLVETREILKVISEQLVNLKIDPTNVDLLNSIFRKFHIMKNTAGFLDITSIVDICEIIEDIFSKIRQGFKIIDENLINIILKALDTISYIFLKINNSEEPNIVSNELMQQLKDMAKIDIIDNSKDLPIKNRQAYKAAYSKKLSLVSKNSKYIDLEIQTKPTYNNLNNLNSMAAELIIIKNKFIKFKNNVEDKKLLPIVADLDAAASKLHDTLLNINMQAVKKLFNNIKKVVSDVSANLEKEINFNSKGEEIYIDKKLLAVLFKPIAGAIINFIKYCTESTDQRIVKNRQSTGNILLSFAKTNDKIIIIIENNSGPSSTYIPEENKNNTFGEVNLNELKTIVSKLNGTLNVESTATIDMRVCINLPLNIDLLPVLIISVEQQTFAIPSYIVDKIINLNSVEISIIDGQKVIILANEIIPMFYLNEWLKDNHLMIKHKRNNYPGYIIIISSNNRKIGIVVDCLLDLEKVIIKPLDNFLKKTPGISGIAVNNNGKIFIILNIQYLLMNYAYTCIK